jgi:iron uptake system component EfeO
VKRFVLLLVLVVLAGCGSDDSSDEAASTTAASSSGTAVELVATDYKFDRGTVDVDAAGQTTFRLKNEGGTGHALEIEGQGIEEETEEIGPGESAEVTVDLKAGQYEFYCPVSNHRSLGMEGTLVVGGAAAGGVPTTTDETDTDDDGGTTTDDGAYGG